MRKIFLPVGNSLPDPLKSPENEITSFSRNRKILWCYDQGNKTWFFQFVKPSSPSPFHIQIIVIIYFTGGNYEWGFFLLF